MALWMLGEFRFKVGEPYVIEDEVKYSKATHCWNKYRVDVVVEFKGAEYLCYYTGSKADYDRDIEPEEREVVECVVREIVDAYTGPVEFMEMAFMEPPDDVEFIKVIYDLLMYAKDYGADLEELLTGDWWEEGEMASRITEVSE